jgi:hypothetical protein
VSAQTVQLSATTDRTTRAATYDGVTVHARTAPLANRFSYTTRPWLVDLNALPRLPRALTWLMRFDAADHLGDPAATIRANIDTFLATEGIDLTGGRVLMLANARALGRVENPISVHWCYDAGDSLAAVIAEVHNTYGDRHAYLQRPDDGGHSVMQHVDKQMYVSPFNPVAGTYRISVSAPGDRISVAVTLERDDQAPFVATLQATRRPRRHPLAEALGTAAGSWRTSALIRWQGIRLFLRGLRIEPRPVHPSQKAVS